MEEPERNPNEMGTKMTVIRTTNHSTVHALTAMIICLGLIHLNVLLFLLFVIFCRTTFAFLMLGLIVLLSIVPVDDNSKLGQAYARYLGKYAPGYFPVTVHMEDARAFDQNKAYVLAAEPHSVFPIGCLSLLSFTGLMPLSKTKALASTAMFHIPFLRQISTWMGLVPATKKNFIRYLEAGYSCLIIPGGVQEIIYMNHDYEVAFLKRRHGFVQVAIETGSPLVPVFCFGQGNVFKWWKPQGKFYVHVARTIRFAPLIFWGAFGLPIPYRKPVHVVVGRPIEIRQNLKPSREEVAEVHARFVSAIEKLFERYRGVTGHSDIDLRII